ncbi:GAG-pre-integrase domain [Arabidopsis thaliana x Arabidopsis arenosa]|uniref:GAG-pre-integrase domain n=1 Tax=Arabidopsis thaliana x Arabidopsis arenosa TaxID=1240361 RepID=A0A8T2GN19_9BRAS|nr:GAG-pre-integrase domain [Arabidopsis thaliana x Arabidopsis arenosa]
MAAIMNPEKIYGVSNIKSHIPVILDIEESNYDAWRELFLTHCLSFDVLGHIDGTLQPANAADVNWQKRDGIVKLWLYGTLTPKQFQGSFVFGSTSREIWLRIENQFRNNKDARALRLDNELRTKEIGDMKIADYCREMKKLPDSLSNVDAPVQDRTLMMYVLNGPTQMTYRGRGGGNNRFRGGGRSSYGYNRQGFNSWNRPPFYPNPYQMWNHQWGYPLQLNANGQGFFGLLPPYHSQQSNAHFRTPKPESTADLAEAFNTFSLQDPPDSQWYMDSGATAYLTSGAGNNLQLSLYPSIGKSVIFGNGGCIPVTATGSLFIANKSRPLTLHNVLVTRDIIKNLVSVRRFTKDNKCSIEFDPFGFSIKDLRTKRTLLRNDSSGDLYPVFPAFNKTSAPASTFLAQSSDIWHRRLPHPSNDVLKTLISYSYFHPNKKTLTLTCNACQIGKHVKLPFYSSTSKSISNG